MRYLKNSKLMVVSISMVISVIAATAAEADSTQYKHYVRVGIGANQPTQDLEDAGYDSDTGAAVAYGRYLGKHLVIEGAVDYFSGNNELSGSTTSAGTYDRDDAMLVFAQLLTLKAQWPLGPLKLFAGGGVGVYTAVLYSNIDTERRSNDIVATGNDTAFGIHAVVGGYYDITPRIFLGIEGLYRLTSDIKINEVKRSVPVEYNGNLDGYAVNCLVGYRF